MVANGYVLITSWLMLTHIWADVCHSRVQMLAAAASVGWCLLNAVWLTEHSMSIDLHLRYLAVDFWPASITVVEFPGLSPAALKACVVTLSKYPPILRVITINPLTFKNLIIYTSMPQRKVWPVDEVGMRSLWKMYSILLERENYFRKLTVWLSPPRSAKPAALAFKRNSL